jgi:uncharacterized protein YajQ (UPF0234 family)
MTRAGIQAAGGLSPGRLPYNERAFQSSSQACSFLQRAADHFWRKHMPSFDVVSELDKHEVTNAVDNAIKELDRRYDLKGKGSFVFKELTVTLTAEAEFQLEAMIEILKMALVKRKIDVQCLEVKDAYASGKEMKQEAVLREGIEKELAKKIVAHVKDAKLKVQAAIQGEQVRITGKKRDDLQEAIAALRAKEFGMPLQFNNFRD